jgi:hypothetical protein
VKENEPRSVSALSRFAWFAKPLWVVNNLARVLNGTPYLENTRGSDEIGARFFDALSPVYGNWITLQYFVFSPPQRKPQFLLIDFYPDFIPSRRVSLRNGGGGRPQKNGMERHYK